MLEAQPVSVASAQEMTFTTPLGRAVFAALFRPPRINVSELFLPRRTAFVYELDAEPGTSDIPTTLRRSKADCPPVGRPYGAFPMPCPALAARACCALGAVDPDTVSSFALLEAVMHPA